jgi:putative transposase
VRRQWELMGVSRSGLYYQPVGESEQNLRLMRLLDEQYTRTPFYGSRKMTEWLATAGHVVNRKRVSRLMELMGIEAVYPKAKLSRPGEGHRIYPYLLRGTTVGRVNQVWSTDITYIRMEQGFVYLVAVMDWFSRFVLSWALSLTMEGEFCVEALKRALRRPAGHFQQRPGVAVHQRDIHRGVGGPADRDQHGWARPLYGQHLR